MRHFITFRENGDDVRLDVSAICSSLNTSTTDARCTKDYTSATSPASFTIGWTPDKVHDPYDGTLIDRQALYERTIALLLLSVETKAEAKVTIMTDDRRSIVYRGYIDPSDISISRSGNPGPMEISCKDYTTDLDRRIGLNLVWKGRSVNRIVDDLLSLVYTDTDHAFVGTGDSDDGTLLGTPTLSGGTWEGMEESGTTYSIVGTRNLISDLPDTAAAAHFVVTDEDGTTYREAIDTLLRECGGYVLHYIHSSNRFEVVKAIPDEVDDTQIRTVSYMAEGGVTTRTGVYSHDGILLKWPTIETKENDNVYSEDITLEYPGEGQPIGVILPNGAYHPTDGDVTPTRQEYRKGDADYATGASRKENGDLSLLYAEDARLVVVSKAYAMNNRGPVADMDALEALTDPVLGDYAYVTSLDGYRVHDGSAWVYTATPSLGSDGKGDVYVDQGDIPTYSDLPASATEGWFFTCTDTGYQWCWIGLLLFPELHTTDVDMTDGNPAFYPRSMWALGRNRSGGLVNLQIFSVTATSVARTKVNRTTFPSVIKDPDEVEATYITDSASAEAYALWLYNSRRIACTTATWTEWDGQRTPLSRLGERVRVEFMPGTEAVFCVIQIDAQAVTRRSRSFRVTALMVSGFESVFSGRHETTVPSTPVEVRRAVDSAVTYASSASGTVVPSAWSDTRTVVPGEYLWTRTVTVFSDGTESTSYTVTYNGTEAKVFSFSLDRQTYQRNMRLSGNQGAIAITQDIQGYTGLTLSWACYVDGTLDNSLFDSQSAPTCLNIPYRNAYSRVRVVMSASGGALVCERTISAVDVTQDGEGMYLGELSALPATPSVGDMYIEGDYFMASASFTGTDGNPYLIGVPYCYDGSDWYNTLDLTDSSNVPKAMQCLGGVMKAGVAVPSTAALWGWFANLVAQNGVIRNLFSQAINIMTGGYIRGGERYLDDNTGTMATNAWDKVGFWFGADGRLMANLQSDANNNTFVGTDVANANASVGSYNTAMGYGALHSNASGGNYNVALGDLSLYSNTTGDYNIAIGHEALYSSSTNSYNVGIGYQTLYNATSGNYNIGLGYQSLLNLSTGSNNIGIGYQALYSNTTSNSNTALGYRALYSNTTGSLNVAIGDSALYKCTTALSCVALGFNALYNLTTGSSNVALGGQAGKALTSGERNTAVGNMALGMATTGSSNVALGADALFTVSTGRYNVGIGNSALPYSGTGYYQVNINDQIIVLSFKKGRRYSDVYTVLKSFFINGQYESIGCMGEFEGQGIHRIGYEDDGDDNERIYLYGNQYFSLYSSTSTTLNYNARLCFIKPTNLGTGATYDCLS